MAGDHLSSEFHNVATAALERVARVICSTAVFVVSVVARFVLAEQRLSIVLGEEALGAWVGQAATFVSTAGVCVRIVAFFTCAEHVHSPVNERLARWTQC